MAFAQVPEHLPTSITLSDTVHIDFHPGFGGVAWGTLHTPTMATEVGSARSPDDLQTVLTMAAAALLERPYSATQTYVDRASGERWVLIGSWVLSARLGREHVDLGTEAAAATYFNRLIGGRL